MFVYLFFALRNRLIKEVTDVEIKRAFDDLDLNGNGFLSPDEVLVAFRRFPDPPSREEIDSMISEFDKSTTLFS